ncbi:MAG: hypothetical protein E6G09_00725 [Actinobacteria bacterium]|nr:MAG: hypothetical protein E6G09_00725 [Actinomycetota bacterium]
MSMKTLVVYLMSGPETPELAAAAVAGGADVVELGFPFSDPLADGPVIRRAAERALGQGMRTRACLDCVARSRELLPETPLVPMTYAALLEAYGWDRFARDAQSAGATSLIETGGSTSSRSPEPQAHAPMPPPHWPGSLGGLARSQTSRSMRASVSPHPSRRRLQQS